MDYHEVPKLITDARFAVDELEQGWQAGDVSRVRTSAQSLQWDAEAILACARAETVRQFESQSQS